MVRIASQTGHKQPQGFLGRLAHDQAGNTLALIAAAILPMLAMVGGGIDMGRSYLSQTRLQQACDAGVLAARKKLASEVDLSLGLPADANDLGQRFFNINFQDGAYGTENISFVMDLEDDNSVSGVATVDVPTTIMSVFGNSEVAIDVVCSAQLNMNNTDIMFVLDTTGSMLQTNDGDSLSRIEALREVVKNFHGTVEGAKAAGTRIRYGFVPYATNVNVGGLLKSDWMVENWTYQSRVAHEAGLTGTGTSTGWVEINSSSTGNGTKVDGPVTVEATCPDDTDEEEITFTSPENPGPPRTYYTLEEENGIDYDCTFSDGAYTVEPTTYTNYERRRDYEWRTTVYDGYMSYTYDYMPITHDVSAVKNASDGNALTNSWAELDAFTTYETVPTTYWYEGCIEERQTYEIDDYSNVDLTQALDLNLDLVPTPGTSLEAIATQWRPMFRGITYDRGIDWDGEGEFLIDAEMNSSESFMAPDWFLDDEDCPSPSRLLAEMDADDVATYVDALEPAGYTYHDIGMIWGGRLISGTGLFADHNADVSGRPTSRHLIFLTDGETRPLDIMYSSYGIEPLDKRRWSLDSTLSLTETVEERFRYTCAQVRSKNVTIWVISFGTDMTQLMIDCAGDESHAIQAATADELQQAFTKIAGSLADLRINK